MKYLNMNQRLGRSRRRTYWALVTTLIYFATLLVFVPPVIGQEIKGSILQQELDSQRNGYTVMKVWGTYYEMGYAHGSLLGDQIVDMIGSLKTYANRNYNYNNIMLQISDTYFPQDMLDEIDGMVAGIQVTVPGSTVTRGDIIMLNTIADWEYNPACRSHSCWGTYVNPPVKTLSTRRLDFKSLYTYFNFLNIVVCAYEPSDTSQTRWVNLSFPGCIISLTSVNEFGTIVSIHDSPNSSNSRGSGGKYITRCASLRYMATIPGLPEEASEQTEFVYLALQGLQSQGYMPWTGSFLNYYVPEGNAGVISCSPSQGFYNLRRPNPSFFGGEMIVTSNVDTNGTSWPSDVNTSAFSNYYNGTKPKTLSDHWGLLADVDQNRGAFQLSVEYRGRANMTIWARGRLSGTKTTPTIKLEWNELFGEPQENGCSSSVASYPYTQSFETGSDDWLNDSEDDINWTLNSGSTPSSGTGPSGAHEGTYYFYIEASSPNYPAKTALLNGPCFDLSNTTDAELTFWYHMYGSSMGYLDVDISEDTENWTNVWHISGDQGDSWNQASVDLASYSGKTITIRFSGVTGSGYQSDISIDDIEVTATPQVTCGIDEDCDDGVFCNGAETCNSGFCEPGDDPCPDQVCVEDNQQCIDGPTAQMEFGWEMVGEDYTTVHLANFYVSPVVVCSVNYNNNNIPVVARVTNVTSSSFDVYLQNPSGSAVSAEKVSYLVVEEGTWTIDNVKIEAHKYLSTVTDDDNSWIGEVQSYNQSYTNPVVLGQVMSDNDPFWSVFWCHGSGITDPPSSISLSTGKMVGEDLETSRTDETIGYIVFEAGHGTINGVEFEAALGADSVQGVTDSAPYMYNFNTAFSSAPQVALTTMAGMDGPNGGWSQTYGSTPTTETILSLSIDEDQVGDNERNHTTEQVGYVVFGSVSNDPPVADGREVTTDEDTPVTFNLTGSDPENAPLTFSVVGSPSNGVLSGTAPNLTYTPDNNFNGNDTFTFRVNDGQIDSNTATVTINVTAVNDVPAATGQSITTNEDTQVTITLAGTDVDGDVLTYTVGTQPANGILSGSAPALTYTPDDGYSGSDSFTFEVNDGKGGIDTATVSITIVARNDPPVADGQVVTTDEDTQVPITLSGSDPEGDSLTFSVVGSPSNGVLSGSAPNLTYTPDNNFNGSDTITFRVNDGQNDSNTATVTINVTAVNDAPAASGQSVTTNEDTPVAITLTGTDVDEDALTYTVVTQPANGALSGNAPDLTYTPGAEFSGSDSFIFTVDDGKGGSDTATVSITIVAQNDPPVADIQTVTTDEDKSISITLTGRDPEGTSLTYSVVGSPTNGVLSGTAPNIIYTPNNNFNGQDTFVFKVSDGQNESNPAMVTITVTAVNDAPIASGQSVTTNEDTSVAITLSGTDVDGDALTYSVDTQPANGSLIGSAPALTYTPGPGYSGSDSFTFHVNDGKADSNQASVTITVNPLLNQPPTVDAGTSQTITLPNTASLNGTVTDDGLPQNSILTTNWSTVSGPGVVTFGNSSAVDTTASFSASGTYVLVLSANDGELSNSDTVSITVNPASQKSFCGADPMYGGSRKSQVVVANSFGYALLPLLPSLLALGVWRFQGMDKRRKKR